MTRAEFDALADAYECKYCGTVGQCVVSEPEGNAVMHRGGRVDCRAPGCERFLFWLKAEDNARKRPTVKRGEVDACWEEYGGHCAVCNLTVAELDVLGIERTRQHVPAYKTVADGGRVIPMCGWCQNRAAAEMARMENLVKRVAAKLSMPAGRDGGRDDDVA